MKPFDEILAAIDWSRMAVPQPDGYDTDAILALAGSGASPLRPAPYQRRPPEGSHAFCGGMVAVRAGPERGLGSASMVPAALDHPHLDKAAALLARWPAAHAQFQRLVEAVHPYCDLAQVRLGQWAFGSSSHSHEADFGCILVTVDDPLGLAQALLHEMAHHKLRAMGVSVEVADRLIANPPDQRFDSPIRKDRTRPMTAVFHAQYSFMHVTALDLYMLKKADDPLEATKILMLLARNVIRMEAGYREIDVHLITDSIGQTFVEPFMRWSRQVLDDGRAALDAHGYTLA